MRRRPHGVFVSRGAYVFSGALVLAGAFCSQPAHAAPEAAPPPPPAEPPPPPPKPAGPTFLSLGGDWKLSFHGIVGGSFYVQDTPAFVFNGQGPLIPLSKPGDGYTTGGDVRQTRFSLSISGPQVIGATPKALIEMDFFGLNGPGGYGEVSVLPRLRLAYTELNWGNDIIRVGQDHELIIGFTPESIGHQAYPVTYFNGFIGWREPGIGYFHTIPMGEDSKLEAAVQIIKSDWENPADFGSNNLQDLNVDFGQLSGWPGVEGRVKFTSPNFMAWVAGHYNHVEGSHGNDIAVPPQALTPAQYGGVVSNLTASPTRDWDVYVGTAGFKVNGGGFTLGATAYYGENLAPFLGEELHFVATNNVAEWGASGEVGYELPFLKSLSIWGIGGTARPKEGDLETALREGGIAGAARVSSVVVGGMIRFQEKGFTFGPEFYHVMTKYEDENGNAPVMNITGAGAPDGEVDVNQFMMSGMYFF